MGLDYWYPGKLGLAHTTQAGIVKQLVLREEFKALKLKDPIVHWDRSRRHFCIQ